MIKIDKLKVKLVDLVKAGRDATPEFTAIVERLATAINDDREGLKVYQVVYFRHVQQCGNVWLKATDEADAKEIAQEILEDDCADEDERVVRFDDALEDDEEVNFALDDVEEVTSEGDDL